MSILRMPAVKAETGHASHASIYTSVHDGTFTVPVPIGQRAVGWPDHEVKAINQARIRGDSDDQEDSGKAGKAHHSDHSLRG